MESVKTTLLYQGKLSIEIKFQFYINLPHLYRSILVLPWILPKKIHDSLLLVTDIDNSRKVKALRFLLNSILKHQKYQQKSNDERVILHNIQIQNVHLTGQLVDLQRSLNSLANQSRLQQEDHFELERRLMELKIGRDPMMMSSDSVFEHCSVGSLSIDMNNIDMNSTYKY